MLWIEFISVTGKFWSVVRFWTSAMYVRMGSNRRK
jgi:hypothetical protein